MDGLGITPAAPKADALPVWLLLAGAAVSAGVGYLALSLLVRVLRAGRFWLFGLYCIAAGFVTILLT
jgi:undecaprenyl pyrophosphate phosphatase UppP